MKKTVFIISVSMLLNACGGKNSTPKSDGKNNTPKSDNSPVFLGSHTPKTLTFSDDTVVYEDAGFKYTLKASEMDDTGGIDLATGKSKNDIKKFNYTGTEYINSIFNVVLMTKAQYSNDATKKGNVYLYGLKPDSTKNEYVSLAHMLTTTKERLTYEDRVFMTGTKTSKANISKVGATYEKVKGFNAFLGTARETKDTQNTPMANSHYTGDMKIEIDTINKKITKFDIINLKSSSQENGPPDYDKFKTYTDVSGKLELKTLNPVITDKGFTVSLENKTESTITAAQLTGNLFGPNAEQLGATGTATIKARKTDATEKNYTATASVIADKE